MIFQSRKPQAKAFTRWVTGEVLPAIRKEGRYEAERRPLHQISYSSNRMEALSAAVMDVEDKTQRVEIWNAATALLHSCMVVKEEAAV